jgi:FkbM family methyltransferase
VTYFLNSIKFFFLKTILRRKFLNVRDKNYDLFFQVEIHDVMGRKIFKRGSLHPEHTKLLSALPFEDGDVILDIGANIGWYSLVLKKSIPKDVTIYAFEPEPLNYQLLKKNIEVNQVGGIKSVNKAVAEANGTSTLFLYYSKNSGRHSLLDVNPQTNRSIGVETINIESFLQSKNVQFKSVRLIKIDIEGYELFAFKGAMQLLNVVPYIFLEYSPALMRKGGEDPAKLIHWLSNFEFNFYKVDGNNVLRSTAHQLMLINQTQDLLLVKKSVDTGA